MCFHTCSHPYMLYADSYEYCVFYALFYTMIVISMLIRVKIGYHEV
jgi:hypothetical protein